MVTPRTSLPAHLRPWLKTPLLTEPEPPSPFGRIIAGLGITLAMVGLAKAVGLFGILVETDAASPSVFRPLMMAIALILAGLSAVGSGGDNRRLVPAGRLIVGLFLCAGLFALWRFPADIDASAGADSWAGLLGCAAILLATWRIWRAPLALAGLSALIYGLFWRLSLDLAQAAPAAIREVGNSLWSDLDHGALGWLIEVLLSTVLPFFLLGGMLAGRIFLGSSNIESGGGGRLTTRIQDVIRFMVPTMALGALIMTKRPGIDFSASSVAWLGLVGVGMAWFWIMPSATQRAARVATPIWLDLAHVGVAVGTVVMMGAGGFSLAGSAIAALAAVIALGVAHADVRRRPMIILHALARSGVAFGRLLLSASAVGMILAILDQTGLPFDLAQILVAIAGEARLPLVLLTAVVSIALGLAMPGLVAYLIVVALIGPSLRTVGLTDLTMHLPVLFLCAGASAMVMAQAASDARGGETTGALVSGKAASR